MIKPSVTLAELVRFLNELASLDPGAIHNLVEIRTRVNTLELADHPTVQVAKSSTVVNVATQQDEHCYVVGLLGVLNGLFGIFDEGPLQGLGAICVSISDTDKSKLYFFLRDANGNPITP